MLKRSALGNPTQALLLAPGEGLLAPWGATGPRLRNAGIGNAVVVVRKIKPFLLGNLWTNGATMTLNDAR